MTRIPARQSPIPTGTEACLQCGTPLQSDGFCYQGNGYPYLRRQRVQLVDQAWEVRTLVFPCPFACPVCRHPLEWDGRCEACHGCTTADRADWTFPGDRYDRWDDAGRSVGDASHWVRTDGPRPALTRDQVVNLQKVLP